VTLSASFDRMPGLSLVAAAALAFVSTDLDDLALLAAWFSDRTNKTSHIVVGQLLGIAALSAASVAIALFGLLLPRPALGALGLLPIGIGVMKLIRPEDDDDEKSAGSATASILSIAGVAIANGGDNLAIYVPFFAAARNVFEIATIVLVFLVMTLAWIALARWFVRHPVWGELVERWGHRVVPWLLIVLGAGILYEAETIGWLLNGMR
jgi:cadmium resistance protein CadD (predicted permease)